MALRAPHDNGNDHQLIPVSRLMQSMQFPRVSDGKWIAPTKGEKLLRGGTCQKANLGTVPKFP